MATATPRGRTRGRLRASGYTRPVEAEEKETSRFEELSSPHVFGDEGCKSSTDEDTSDESNTNEQVPINTIDTEERKKKIDRLVYKYMARMLISGLQEHRLDQIMQKYLKLDDKRDDPPAAPPPSSSGSSIDGAKQVAPDPPSASAPSRRPVAACEPISNIKPSSLAVIEEAAVNPEVVQAIIPDVKKPMYPSRGRGRGIRNDCNDTNKRVLGRGLRLN